jgi:hypothetical protein
MVMIVPPQTAPEDDRVELSGQFANGDRYMINMDAEDALSFLDWLTSRRRLRNKRARNASDSDAPVPEPQS